MNWIRVNEEYLDYLRQYEARIPFSDYGDDKCKPFFGTLFEVDDIAYITQVSHPQERHKKLKNLPDFKKIFDPKDRSRLIAVVNLNYMFPVPKAEIEKMEYKNIESYRTFKDEKEKTGKTKQEMITKYQRALLFTEWRSL